MTEGKQRRGFAAMSREKVLEISSKGGKAAHAAGTAHQFTTEEARVAGKKGGTAPHRSRGRRVVDPSVQPQLPTQEGGGE
jgi:general stress protein YciG